MKKKTKIKLVTIKVTEEALKNFNMASAISGKPQYEMSEEGSSFVHGKYLSQQSKSKK